MQLVIAAACLVAASWATPARAILDVEDRGPVLDAGNFRMRITNAGILGNAYYNVGRSSDPSFEYPKYSGIEMLNHAEVWVGAINAEGEPHVSGGPMLEWRPTLDSTDVVRLRRRTELGGKRGVDDDGDGRVDEEVLNGKDDDGDGEVDEDLGVIGDQLASADYVDDRPEAVGYGYPGGETHRALELSVHQDAYAWSAPGYDGAAVLTFHITNHGRQELRNVYLGVMADLDSRRVADRAGHRANRIEYRSYAASKFEGLSQVLANDVAQCPGPGDGPPCQPVQCFTELGATVPVVESASEPTLPVVALLPLDHTLDPIARLDPTLAFAPYKLSFIGTAYSTEGIPGGGGLPVLDADRYLALAGQYATASSERVGDWAVLLSCGPFRALEPGASLDFTVALIAAPSADSLEPAMARMALLHHGVFEDLLPNATAHPDSEDYHVGATGVTGHELCLDPPEGHTFTLDVDCTTKIPDWEILGLIPQYTTVHHGQCVWADLDCDECTGLNGKETQVHWIDPGESPPAPTVRITPGDRRVDIEWNNLPEVLINGGAVGHPHSRFIGYRLYKLSRWNGRQSLMPPSGNWSLYGSFGLDSLDHGRLLGSIADTSLDYERILYEQKLYPVGRYRVVDREVLDGFDYVYMVATVYEDALPQGGGVLDFTRLETPLIAKFDDRVTPHAAATSSAGKVTVVPNPFRASAEWDRLPVFGDPLPRHIDFMHLPKDRCTIRIYTLAGDLVKAIEHDGSAGDGQASWDLISRNGQDVESGIYLFTVESGMGHQVGKFVVVR